MSKGNSFFVLNFVHFEVFKKIDIVLCIFADDMTIMRLVKIFIVLLLCSTQFTFAQDEKLEEDGTIIKKVDIPKAKIDQYKIYTIQKDTTIVDTSLTIQSEYKYNYLRKDLFGLMPFANEGQSYTRLKYSLKNINTLPSSGHEAKRFNFMTADDIRYYNVATPFTDLYFKTVMEQGQNLDAFITMNTSPQFNFSVAYKGLRSLGKYINQLSSTGNFRFTSSYATLDKRYVANGHFVAQDILNGENGGLTSDLDFESEDPAFNSRPRLEVYFKDAESLLAGKRLFLDHSFRINKEISSSNWNINHQINFEYESFDFSQKTLISSILNSTGNTSQLQRFGEASQKGGIINRSRYNKLYNRVGAEFENTLLGRFEFFIEDFRDNNYYDKIIIADDQVIPSSINTELNRAGGKYAYAKNNLVINGLITTSINGPASSAIVGSLEYQFTDDFSVEFEYKNLSKIPDHIYNLHQSSYLAYNWSNDFKNEKINSFGGTLKSPWVAISANYQILNDHLYFFDDLEDQFQLLSPKQYNEAINYLSIEASKEFKYGKFALDNTVLFQQVQQSDNILNVPEFVTRNTLYYSDHLFKKALYFQTGFTLNYFTMYYANEYNPLLGEFFVQNQKEIGNFPMVDFFINLRIQQTRIFVKAEHFNSSFTGNTYYSAPHYPYRDFMLRFGLVWNFFQ